MRVFEIITYNLKQIAFKDTKAHLDDMLHNFGVEYTDVAFCFSSDKDGAMCDKVIKQFPHLATYKQHYEEPQQYGEPLSDYRLTSIFKKESGDIALYIDRSHRDDIDSLLKKIPRPIHFGFMNVMLDRVSWYGDGVQSPCFTPNALGERAPYSRFSTYYSNSIRFFKEFDYGTKLNIVEIMIDRTGTDVSLLPRPEAFEEICRQLGKPLKTELKCVFDEEERTALSSAHATVKQMIDKQAYTDLFAAFDTELPHKPEAINRWVTEELTPLQGVSPKKIFSAIAKKHGYRSVRSSTGEFVFEKVLADHHKWEVCLLIKPFTSRVEAKVSVFGYNFNHFLATAPATLLHEESELTAYAENVFEMAHTTEDQYSSTLSSLYGKTPDWF